MHSERLPAPFIVGVSRSGTTLLRLMLDAHPSLALPPECQFTADVLHVGGSGERVAAEACAETVRAATWPDYGLDADAFRAAVVAARARTAADVLRIFYAAYAARHGKPRWGDKTPGNVRRMDAIARALPEARFIHLIRNGLDVAVSLRDLPFGPSESYAACVAHWAKTIAAARAQRDAGVPYLEVRYEALVADPRTVLRAICAFAACDYDEAMLAYPLRAAERLSELRDVPGREPRAARIAMHAGTREAPRPDRIGVWRDAMTEDEVAACTAAGGALLREFRAG